MFHDVEQNTDEWFLLRAGKLTSSNLATVMANYPKAFGDPAKKLAVTIALEQITGKPSGDNYTNEHMDRGHEQEPIARLKYEEEHFCKVSNGGFFDKGFMGCSPDGLVGDVGVIEIKSAIPSAHYARVKRQDLDPTYKWQCIANLAFTERSWLDFISYCPDFPEGRELFVYRIHKGQYPTEEGRIEARVEDFEALVEATKHNILNNEYSLVGAA